jgi:hypothetical protein
MRSTLAGHRRRSTDTHRFAVAAVAITQPAHKHRDIGALAPAISMKLVEHDEIEAVRVRDDGPIKSVLARHQEF